MCSGTDGGDGMMKKLKKLYALLEHDFLMGMIATFGSGFGLGFLLGMIAVKKFARGISG